MTEDAAAQPAPAVAPGQRGGWLTAIWLFDAVLVALSGLLIVLFAHSQQHLTERMMIPWWVISALFFIGERFPVKVQLPGFSVRCGFPEIGLVLGLFFASPLDLCVAYLVSAPLVDLTSGVRAVWRSVWHTFSHVLAVAASAWVFHLLATPADPFSWQGMGATVAAVATFMITDLCLAIMVRIYQGHFPVPMVFYVSNIVRAGAMTLGLIASEFLWYDPRATVLLVPLAVGPIVVYGVYERERRQRDAIEFLGAADVHGAQDVEAAAVAIASRVRHAFHAEMAVIYVMGRDGDSRAYRTTVRLDGADEVMAPVDPPAHLIAEGPDRLLRAGADEDLELLSGSRTARGGDGLVALVEARGRRAGLLVVVGHTDDVDRRFVDADLLVLKGFAQRAGQVLENGELERSVAELSARQSELVYRAFHDPLTGLANRALFTDRVTQALLRQRRGGDAIALIYLDLDDFKTVNDTWGHQAGDFVLIEAAQRIRQCLRASDSAARLGGDEFAVLLEKLRDVQEAETVTRRIVESLSHPVRHAGTDLLLGASAGLITTAGEIIDAEQLIRRADETMYEAKRSGKGRFAGATRPAVKGGGV
jgi:diguanylate cyclase (GGDEF)-like protein